MDVIVGGFPCQAFSIAGQRKGFEDTRGTLFFDVLRILKKKKPKYFLLENVKNLISHDNGNTFEVILSSLKDLGYVLDFTVLNSKDLVYLKVEKEPLSAVSLVENPNRLRQISGLAK